MAAATVTLPKMNRVNGPSRIVTRGSVVFASADDTWAVPGIKQIYSIDLVPTTNASFGWTISGNVITLKASGGLTFAGSVTGL